MPKWENVGKIQGEKGEKGDQGERGLQGVAGKNAVVETGENENGTFVKFEDGTMICYHHIPRIDVETTSSIKFQDITYYRFLTAWTYPAIFIEKPSVQFQAGFGFNSFLPFMKRVYNHHPDRISLAVVSVGDFDFVADLSYFAVGRWK